MTSANSHPAEREAAAGHPAAAPVQKGSLWTRFESKVLLSIATGLALTATSVMLIEAFSRGFLNHSYFWAEELVRFLMIWAFFMSLGAAGRSGHHIRTELIVEMLPRSWQRTANGLASLVGIGFSVILFAASVPQVHRYYTMGMQTESTLDLPMWLLFLAMPLGALLLGGYFVGCLIRVLRNHDPFLPHPGAGA